MIENTTQLMRFLGKAAKWRIPGVRPRDERKIFLSFDSQTEGEWPVAYTNSNSSPSHEDTHEEVAGLPRKILLIEDDPEYAEMLSFALEQKGCQVRVAGDAFEAGNEMARHAFDLVITDWRLPPFTGFSTLRKADHEIALDPMAPAEWFEHKKTPVIVVTACDAEEVGREKKLKGRFQVLGVVSKEQNLDGILDSMELLYGNFPS